MLPKSFPAHLLIAISFAATAAHGQDGPQNLRGWQKLFHEQAREYSFRFDHQRAPPVVLISEPILQWNQPVRGGADGAVYLWTQAGRPVAIGTFVIWPMSNGKQGITHELHSLSQDAFKATWRNRDWMPPKDSVAWISLESAQPPAGTAEMRLRQMRELAKLFKAESHDRNDRRWELRLLPRPIYRFSLDEKSRPRDEENVLDGALFGFMEGTDLEVVLLLQARRDTTGPCWEFALARMSDLRLQVVLGERTVWAVDRSQPDQFRAAYCCSTVESRDAPDDP
jgi:hypothetical protein